MYFHTGTHGLSHAPHKLTHHQYIRGRSCRDLFDHPSPRHGFVLPFFEGAVSAKLDLHTVALCDNEKIRNMIDVSRNL